jgi:hypothetical protein
MVGIDESKRRLFVFSIASDSGQVVRLESVDFLGRHELTEDEKTRLIKERTDSPIEALLEKAFEAGIACVVGDRAERAGTNEPREPDDSQEAVGSEEDSDLHRLLLEPLIQNSAAAHLMRSEVVSRAILQSLIEHSLKSRSGGNSTGVQSERV